MPELDRRDFLKLVGVGAGAAAAAGCSDPVEKLIPYVVQPDVITPGIPVYYASSCTECPTGCGLHVKTREGRPIKLEGNPNHPVNRGTLCTRGQVGIGRTYHPDRFAGPMRRSPGGGLEPVTWDEAIALLAEKVGAARAGTWLLGGEVGPTLDRLVDRWVSAVGAGGRVTYEPFAPEALREACRELYGEPRQPRFDLTDADLVIDFGAELAGVDHARQLADARAKGARVVYVGPRLSLAAASSDEWLVARPGTEGLVALALAGVVLRSRGGELPPAVAQLVAGLGTDKAASISGVEAATLERIGRAAASARAPVALPPGVAVTGRRAVGSAAAVLILDHAVGAVGSGVQLDRVPEARARTSYREVLRLIDSMKSGRVGVLLVHESNPVYSLPAAAGFVEALDKVPFVVATASMPDETTSRAHLVLPDHTPMESWGDAEPRPGIRSLIQPTVRPLFDTRGFGDTLLDSGRKLGAEGLPQGSWRSQLEAAWSGEDWRAALARGGSFSEVPAPPATLGAGAAKLEVAEPLLEGDGELTLLAVPHSFLSDGRGANLPWLQEIADPVTNVSWQSWVELSHATGERLGVERGDVVTVETPAGAIELPALVRGGIRDDVIAIPTGQGHTVGYYASLAGDGQPGVARGASVIAVLPAVTDESGGRAWLTAKARVSRTGRFQRLPTYLAGDNQRGRMLAEALPAAALAGEHAGGEHAGGEHELPPGLAPAIYSHVEETIKPYDMVDDATAESPYRWAMTVDVDRCNGCAACVAACYMENNLPVVGEEGVLRRREMVWIRIERYIGAGDREGGERRHVRPDREQLGNTDVRHLPMLCQQCGAAPCESVCPVIATYHNPEGLNGMIYNRCVGTRYCSNNCPYKVRRFNFFDYSQTRWPGSLYLMTNPDVTVRQQGVMEKCTFCVQRIVAARNTARDEKRDIRDGEVVTACQQTCPTRAIHFGNAKDRDSDVAKRSVDPERGYHALHPLNTRPAITYKAQVTRGPIEG